MAREKDRQVMDEVGTQSLATLKMKALVVSRLLMGDLNDWTVFARERDVAGRIVNRRLARSATAQTGRGYRELSKEIQKFIDTNFIDCRYEDLAKLCDAVEIGPGLYLRIEQFEERFFRIAEGVRRRVPPHAHVAISTYGLQFEYPELHFLNDLEAGLLELRTIASTIDDLQVTDRNLKSLRPEIKPLISREKFVSRSVIGAAFSLVEAFMSGCFYAAQVFGRIGAVACNGEMRKWIADDQKKQKPLRERLATLSAAISNGQLPPSTFDEFIKIGKRLRDAIHHTSPFERKGVLPGQRLLDLYQAKTDAAVEVALLGIDTVIQLSTWVAAGIPTTETADRCEALRADYIAFAADRRTGLSNSVSRR